jgi:hypothetical protein
MNLYLIIKKDIIIEPIQSRPQVERLSYCSWPKLLNLVSKAGSTATAEARTDLLGIYAQVPCWVM